MVALALSAPVAFAAGWLAGIFTVALGLALCRVAGVWPFTPPPLVLPAPLAAKAAAWNPAKEIPVFSGADLVGYLAKSATQAETVRSYFPAPAARDFRRGQGVLLIRAGGGWAARDKDDAGPAPPELVRLALPPGLFRAVALALLLLAPVGAKAQPVAYPEYYRPDQLSQYGHKLGDHAPGAAVCTRGYAEMVHDEKDGDVHVWICPSAAKRHMLERRAECVLLEIVPSRPLPRPGRGDHVEACGLWVEADHPHGWSELHPGVRLEVIP